VSVFFIEINREIFYAIFYRTANVNGSALEMAEGGGSWSKIEDRGKERIDGNKSDNYYI